MIPEFPMPEEIELLHSKPIFARYSSLILPTTLRTTPEVAIRQIENPIDLITPLQQCRSLSLQRSSWTPSKSTSTPVTSMFKSFSVLQSSASQQKRLMFC